MTLAGVKAGDIVLCDRMGRVFYAIVSSATGGSSRSSRSTGASPTGG